LNFLYGNESQTGNVDDRFSITAEGGVLYTRGTLDRETRASYLLSIQARDSAGANSLSSVTQVRVYVWECMRVCGCVR